VILFLVVSGISNGTDAPIQHQLEQHYNTLEDCVQASVTLRKVLQAEDNLQIRQTDVFAHCEASSDGLTPAELNAANNKIRRLEKFYSTAKW
jgi:hypothetical protein